MKKQVIHINNTNLINIIKESIDEVLLNTRLNIEDYFDIKSLNKNKIQMIASDMRAFFNASYGNRLSDEGKLIFEDELKTLSIKALRKELSKLGFKQWQIKTDIIANKVRVVILYADLGKNTEIITNEMASFGWTRARISSPMQIHGVMCRAMDFDPNEQKSLTKEAKKFPYLFHWTPINNINSIMLNGLEPRSENNYLTFQPKVHLMKGNISMKTASYLGWQLYNKNINNDNGEYVLIRIKTDLIPDNIEFYGDPRYHSGYFVKETIPSNALELCGKIIYKDKNIFNNEELIKL